jgi:crotonobetainyl-CoA:carnitine CoA-transferase CaiB-like acyl-CoA transferase
VTTQPDAPSLAAERAGPLSGVRVLDLSRMLAGPYCGALLADLGAEVIKIEVPGHGDDARHIGPFRNGESIYFDILNRRKQSVTMNLKDADARSLLLRLAGRSQVLLENFRPGVTEHLGIDYAAVSAASPAIVYASISGYGQSGPMALFPAYDLIVQAASGLMSVTGHPDGPPTKVGESIGDITAGVFAALGIVTALLEATRTGRGTHLDISMLESLLALEVTVQSQYDVSGVAPSRVGNRHPVSTPFGVYQAADGEVILAAANDTLFARVAELIERPEMAADPRYATDALRTEHETEVRAAIEAWTSGRTVVEVVGAAERRGVPTSPILDYGQAVALEQVTARHALVHFDHPIAGSVDYVGQPVRFSSYSPIEPVPSPPLGADTDAVLTGLLGVAEEELAALHARGAL